MDIWSEGVEEEEIQVIPLDIMNLQRRIKVKTPFLVQTSELYTKSGTNVTFFPLTTYRTCTIKSARKRLVKMAIASSLYNNWVVYIYRLGGSVVLRGGRALVWCYLPTNRR